MIEIKNKERIGYIDNAKGEAMLFVIMGHCFWKDSIPYLTHFIYSFHMPFFFIISGYFFSYKGVKINIKKYCRAYIKPYVITAIVILLLSVGYTYFNPDFSTVEALQSLSIRFLWGSGSESGTGMFSSIPMIGATWFLLALFWACFFFTIIRTLNNTFLEIIIIMGLFCLSIITIDKIRLPFSIQAGTCGLLYLFIGHQIRKYNILNRLNEIPNFIWFVIFLVIMANVLLGGAVFLTYCYFGRGLITLVASVFSVLVYVAIIQRVSDYIGGGISWLGNHSLLVLCIHSILLYLQFAFENPFEALCFNPQFNFIVEFLIQLLTVIIIACLFDKIKTIICKR